MFFVLFLSECTEDCFQGTLKKVNCSLCSSIVRLNKKELSSSCFLDLFSLITCSASPGRQGKGLQKEQNEDVLEI